MSAYATCSVVGQMGRLGNQLFQIATTISYALDNGQEYFFPRWDYQEYIKLPIGSPISYYQPVNEINLRYNELPKHSGNVNLHGHFLSTKYFHHHKKEIMKLFKPRAESEGLVPKTKWNSISVNTSTSCAIHVRRADYLNPEQLKAHGVLGMDYYNKAMNIVREKHPDVTFYICSDDLQWCIENFKGVNFVRHANDFEDMLFMSNCCHNIIANSTFSWWSAWMNDIIINPTIIAPRQWFAETEGWDDLYEPNWIVI